MQKSIHEQDLLAKAESVRNELRKHVYYEDYRSIIKMFLKRKSPYRNRYYIMDTRKPIVGSLAKVPYSKVFEEVQTLTLRRKR